MSKHRIYFLHGNAGQPTDLSAVQQCLSSKDIVFINIDSYSLQWVDQVIQEKTKVHIIAHSWGCYQFLQSLPKIHKKVAYCLLLNPYLIAENALPQWLIKVLKTPYLGPLLESFVVQRHHKKNYISFLQKQIYPFTQKDINAYDSSLQHLKKIQTWQQAFTAKLQQQEFPLLKNDIVLLGSSLWGQKDAVMDNQKQQKALDQLHPYLKSITLMDAGHSIFWSHPQYVADQIKKQLYKVGYYNEEKVQNNVLCLMQDHVQTSPHKAALVWSKDLEKKEFQHIDFKNLQFRIQCLAAGLKKIGIHKKDRVIVFLPMSLDMYVAMFAVQQLGAIAVFLDSWARHQHLGACADCVKPKAMISVAPAFDLVQQIPEFQEMPLRILYGNGSQGNYRFDDLLLEPYEEICSLHSEDTALVTFTTGSTGRPKGADRSHRFLSAQHQALSRVIPYTKDDIDMPAFPIFSLNSLASGVTTVLPAINLAQPSSEDGKILVEQILKLNVTCTTLSPSLLDGIIRFCEFKKIILTQLRRVVTGGAAISKDIVEAFYKIAPQSQLWILYGSTEAEPMAHIEGRNMLNIKISPDPEIIEKGVNVGEICEDIEYKFIAVVDGPIELKNNKWEDLEVPHGHIGEFICTGDHVCQKYFNNPEAILQTKIIDNNKVWHRTGDVGYLDDKSHLYIVGRVNNILKKEGKYYFPVQAEILIKRFHFVDRCAFLQVQNNQNTVCIQPRSDVLANSTQLQQWCLEIHKVFLKNEIHLDEVIFLENIPMDPRHHSKVEYGILRKNLTEHSANVILRKKI